MHEGLKRLVMFAVVVLGFPIVFVYASLDKGDLTHQAWKDAGEGNISAILFLGSCGFASIIWVYFISTILSFFC